MPITGLSLNSNLYSKQEEKESDGTDEMMNNEDMMKEIDKLSNSTQEDKASPY